MQRDAAIARIRQIDNTERVGLDLFSEHPLGLELAGVILLVSLIGAVVLARRKLSDTDTDTDTASGVWVKDPPGVGVGALPAGPLGTPQHG
jgi:NADH-quinone oxidoreductase subunit J